MENTKSIPRRPACSFTFKTNPRIQKDSRIYTMLKHGPLPDGDYTYLIRNGMVTEYARWLLIASDTDLRFIELCLLIEIAHTSEAFAKNNLPKLVLREYLFGQFGFDYDYSTLRNALTALINCDHICITPLRSVSCTDQQIKNIRDMMGDDFELLYNYIEEILSEDLFSPAY